MEKKATTLDGVEFEEGDVVWLLQGDVITEKKPVNAVVEQLYPSPDGVCRKGILYFKDGQREEYRLSVFSSKEAAEAALLEEIVVLKLDKSDAHFIWHQLVQGLKKVQQELDLLRISITRELTEIERAMLPFQLRLLKKEEMQEQVDPWISYRDHFTYLMNLLKPKSVREEVFGKRIRECPYDGELG